MAEYSIPRLLFAAPGSSTGKTTVVCAFLQALLNRGISPAAFKSGPDYIDPMFHSRVLGVESRNLDLFFTPEETLRGLLGKNAAGRQIAVLEGAMGYYDGVGKTPKASSWHLARATQTPVILVLDPKGMGLSAAALVQGLLGFRSPHRIAGILLNRCSKSLCDYLAPLLEAETGIPVVGCLPQLPGCAIGSRHLGLVTAAEVADLRQKAEQLAQALEECADLDALLAIARTAPPLEGELPPLKPVTDVHPRIAVARDKAFCFYYRDNLELLEELGAELVPFSPLEDECLPENTCALYLGGGYPELHGQRLGENAAMGKEVRQAVAGGMPTLAECGGFQYLQERLAGPEGEYFPMAGVIPGESASAGKLVRFGYVTLTAQRDNLLCKAGEQIAAHEFHHWDSTQTGDAFFAQKASGSGGWPCIVARGNLFAGYPHLYFYNNIPFAANFVRAAAEYREAHHGG